MKKLLFFAFIFCLILKSFGQIQNPKCIDKNEVYCTNVDSLFKINFKRLDILYSKTRKDCIYLWWIDTYKYIKKADMVDLYLFLSCVDYLKSKPIDFGDPHFPGLKKENYKLLKNWYKKNRNKITCEKVNEIYQYMNLLRVPPSVDWLFEDRSEYEKSLIIE